jgi:hypothetical protein
VYACPNEPQQRPIRDPHFEHLLQLGAIHAIEEGHDVRLDDPPHLTPIDDPLQGAHGLMGMASGPEAIRALHKVLLVDDLQHFAYGVLDQRVLERRHAYGPCLSLSLREVHPSDRLMTVPRVLQPGVQALEVRLQVLSVRLLRDPIHAPRRIWTLAVKGALQGRDIDQMRERVEPSCGFALRSLHDLPKSR